MYPDRLSVVVVCCVLTVSWVMSGSLGGAALLSNNKAADTSLTRITTAAQLQAALKSVNDAPSPTRTRSPAMSLSG